MPALRKAQSPEAPPQACQIPRGSAALLSISQASIHPCMDSPVSFFRARVQGAPPLWVAGVQGRLASNWIAPVLALPIRFLCKCGRPPARRQERLETAIPSCSRVQPCTTPFTQTNETEAWVQGGLPNLAAPTHGVRLSWVSGLPL